MALRENESRMLLAYVKNNPGLTSTEIAGGLTKTHTVMQVTSGLHSLWKGRYVTREKTGETGRGPRFRYFFKTDHPRKSPKHTKRRGPYTKRPVAAPGAESVRNLPENGVEILIAVKGSEETLLLSPEQARALHASLSALLHQ